MAEGPGNGSRWQLAFILLAAIWGMSFLFIKVGLEGLAPLQLALARMLLGGLALLVTLLVSGGRLPRGRSTWFHLFVSAALLNAIPFTLFAYGELYVSSILAGIWNATTPLFVLPVAALLIADERITKARVAGLSIGFIGVLVVLGVWKGLGGTSLGGSLLCLGAAACYGVGFPYTRRYLAGRGDDSLSLACGQILCGALQLAVVTALVARGAPDLSGRVVASVLALGVLGTGLAYVLNYSIIRAAGATVASTVTYFIPVFATLAGITLLGEPMGWNEPAGALIIIAGVALSRSPVEGARSPRWA